VTTTDGADRYAGYIATTPGDDVWRGYVGRGFVPIGMGPRMVMQAAVAQQVTEMLQSEPHHDPHTSGPERHLTESTFCILRVRVHGDVGTPIVANADR